MNTAHFWYVLIIVSISLSMAGAARLVVPPVWLSTFQRLALVAYGAALGAGIVGLLTI